MSILVLPVNQFTMKPHFNLYILHVTLWIIMDCVPWMYCSDGIVNLSREGRPSGCTLKYGPLLCLNVLEEKLYVFLFLKVLATTGLQINISP